MAGCRTEESDKATKGDKDQMDEGQKTARPVQSHPVNGQGGKGHNKAERSKARTKEVYSGSPHRSDLTLGAPNTNRAQKSCQVFRNFTTL